MLAPKGFLPKVINSMTILLPAWKLVPKDMNTKVTIIPCNVTTWWNSTYDLLDYCLTHWSAIDRITQRHDLGLQEFELTDKEWNLAEQLHDSLKVHLLHIHMVCMLSHTATITASLYFKPVPHFHHYYTLLHQCCYHNSLLHCCCHDIFGKMQLFSFLVLCLILPA